MLVTKILVLYGNDQHNTALNYIKWKISQMSKLIKKNTQKQMPTFENTSCWYSIHISTSSSMYLEHTCLLLCLIICPSLKLKINKVQQRFSFLANSSSCTDHIHHDFGVSQNSTVIVVIACKIYLGPYEESAHVPRHQWKRHFVMPFCNSISFLKDYMFS